MKASGEKYFLPITMATAEYAWQIPQGSELINQTSMTTDKNGRPYIATYWKEKEMSGPQYFVVYHDGKQWMKQKASCRISSFSLSGGGTKKIPISRPQIVLQKKGKTTYLFLIYRDLERDNHVSLNVWNSRDKQWKISDLTSYSIGDWEPTYDTERWKKEHVLDLFIQKAIQGDGEKMDTLPAQPVTVLSWRLQ